MKRIPSENPDAGILSHTGIASIFVDSRENIQ